MSYRIHPFYIGADEKMYKRGLPTLVALLNIVLCWYPYFTNMTISPYYQGESIYVSANLSSAYGALLVTVAISVPFVIDLLVDFIFFSAFENSNLELHASRVILIFSLCVPDLLILLVGVPVGDMRLTGCLYFSRHILLVWSILRHLIGASPFFHTWTVVLIHGVLSCSFTLMQFYCYIHVEALNYISNALPLAAFLIFCWISAIWFRRLRNKKLIDWSSSEISASIYTIACIVMYLYYFISATADDTLFYGDTMIMRWTYGEGIVTVFVVIAQTRIIKHDVYVKQVKNNNLCSRLILIS